MTIIYQYLGDKELHQVQADWRNLDTVTIQTEEMCLAAIEQSVQAFKFVRTFTEAICVSLMSKDGRLLQHLPIEWYIDSVIIAGINRSGSIVINHLTTQTTPVIEAAINKDYHALKYVNVQTEALCLQAVNITGLALQHVTVQTPAICLAAVSQNRLAIDYVLVQDEPICLALVQQDGLLLSKVKTQTIPVCLAAVTQNGLSLSIVTIQDIDICRAAVTQNNAAIEMIIDRTIFDTLALEFGLPTV